MILGKGSKDSRRIKKSDFRKADFNKIRELVQGRIPCEANLKRKGD